MKRKKGFTMIELVMVIVILGILAAVALPTFFNLRADAQRSACQGALGGIRSGIAIWYAKNAAASGTGTYPAIGDLRTSVMQLGFPVNPYTNSSTIVENTAELSNSSAGWVYDASSGKIWSSAPQTQGSGY